MMRLPISRAKAGLSAWARGVGSGGEIVVLTRRGHDVAALVPVSILDLADHAAREMPSVAEAAAGLSEPVVGAEALSGYAEEGA